MGNSANYNQKGLKGIIDNQFLDQDDSTPRIIKGTSI